MEDRFLTENNLNNIESSGDVQLRPSSFSEFIGQSRVVRNVELMINSALIRNSAMDHALFSGPPGLGKTSLAHIVARALNTNLHVISGPAIDKKGDLAATLTNLAPKDVLFIDEIHRLPIAVEEILYSAMEDFRLDILIGEGPSARTMRIDLPNFTLVGATTKAGLLSNPLRNRFMANLYFDFYSEDELRQIVEKNAQKIKILLTDTALKYISFRSRGTPRVANRILRQVRDYSLVKKVCRMTEEDTNKALALLEIDNFGLDMVDRRILSIIRDFFKGGPVGIDALCATLNEDRRTIEDVYEPFLLKCGFLIRTPRGRMISDKAITHLNNWG